MKLSIILLILVTLVLLTCLLFPDLLPAQGQGSPPPTPVKPTQNPIDGGLALLAAAGGAYAYKKLRKKD